VILIGEIRDAETMQTASWPRTPGISALDAPHDGCSPDDQPILSFFPPHQHEETATCSPPPSSGDCAAPHAALRPAGAYPAAEVMVATATIRGTFSIPRRRG